MESHKEQSGNQIATGGDRHEYASAAMAELLLLMSVSPLIDGIY